MKHPFPLALGDERDRPSGTGHVSYYGSLTTSYAGIPELIWIIDVDSGSINLWLQHDPSDNLDLFLLGSCDASDLLALSNDGDSNEQLWYNENRGGRYYVVADGVEGRFHGLGATLQVQLQGAPTATIQITVLDENKEPTADVRVCRFDSAWDSRDCRPTDSAGRVYWDTFPPESLFHFTASHPSDAFPGSYEQWGNAEDIHPPIHDTLKRTVDRYYPYIDEVEILGADLRPRTEFVLGDTVLVRVHVTNMDIDQRNRRVLVRCRINRDCVFPWDFYSAGEIQDTSDYSSVAYGVGCNFDFTYVPTNISTTYYVQPCSTVTLVGPNLIPQLTDSRGCTGGVAFSVTPSPAPFTITSPTGGEEWEAGTVHNITWTWSGGYTLVNLWYSTNNGSDWTAINWIPEINDGSYAWTVPNAPSTQCLVKVCDLAGSPYDESNRVFSISAPPW